MIVATWNLARPLPTSRRRHALIAAAFNRVSADVWVLTETHDSITPGEGYKGTSTTGADRPGDVAEHWVTIWSRFPSETVAPTSDPVRAVATRVVPPNGPPLIVYGMVLPWLGSSWRHVPAANGRAFAEALETQSSDWRMLRESKPGHDIVVAGDFNQDLAESHYYGSRTNRRRLQLALERAGLVAVSAGNDDPVRRASPAHASIDHVCISTTAQWRARALRRWPDAPKPDRRLSDHFGIEVEFELATIGSR